MKGFKTVMITTLVILALISFVRNLFAETRTLSTRVIITVKAPEPQNAAAMPAAAAEVKEACDTALSQSLEQRIIKVDKLSDFGDISTYSVSERF